MISPPVSEKLEEMRRTLHAIFDLIAELPDGGVLVAVTPLADHEPALPPFTMLIPAVACVDETIAH